MLPAKLSRKAFGYFLRSASDGAPHLLVLSFADDPDMPLRLPGGNLHDNEDPLAGLFRELHEETGLSDLQIIRKLGVQHYYKPYIQANVERHDYLIHAPEGLPDSFSFVVHGKGGDAGAVFDYHWIDAAQIERVDLEFRKDITQEYIPEFFQDAPTGAETMMIPSYWIPQPTFARSSDISDALERVYRERIARGTGEWIEDALAVPKWVFLCWLTDQKGLLLHGSGDADIAEFQPRTPHDLSADDFSKQTAVFAASDGIWPMFYAILDRKRYRLNMMNGALRFEFGPDQLSSIHYFFSITRDVLKQKPWREGVMYILPREGFVVQPPYKLGDWTVHDPHWARLTSVRPLAKLRVAPADFPLLAQVRGHDEVERRARAAIDPYGFPWLDGA